MFDTTEELLRQVALGEDSLLELKSVVFRGKRVEAPDAKSLADEFSAMANGRGGVVVLGVDDKTHRLQPFTPDELDLLETWVRNICLDIVDPSLDCLIRRVPMEDGKGGGRCCGRRCSGCRHSRGRFRC